MHDVQALMPIDRESEPECQEGGFIERAAMRLVAWLLTLSVFEILSLIFATITSLFCCFKVNSCVNASAEVRFCSFLLQVANCTLPDILLFCHSMLAHSSSLLFVIECRTGVPWRTIKALIWLVRYCWPKMHD